MLEKKQTKKIEEILTEIDLEQPAPAEEPMRQYYFMEKARRLVKTQAETLGRPLTFHVTTFGCQMNARDSEKLTGILEQIGYVEEEEENQADFVIYNTCTVRENANQKVYGHLGQLNRVKKKNYSIILRATLKVLKGLPAAAKRKAGESSTRRQTLSSQQRYRTTRDALRAV